MKNRENNTKNITIINKILEKIGLDSKEKEIYITCLKYSQINASSLSRLTKQPRTTVYGILDRLIKKSLIKTQQTNKGTNYSAVQAEKIITMLESQQQELEKNITLLKKHKDEFHLMSITQFKNLPAINYYEGIDAVHMIYNLYQKSQNTMALFDVEGALKHSEYSVEELVSVASRGEGHTKEILLESKASQQYKKLISSDKNEVKLLPFDQYTKVSSDTLIMDTTYYHIAYTQSPIIIEIKNDIFLQTQKMFFMELWNRL